MASLVSVGFRALHASGTFPYLLAAARGARPDARERLADWRAYRARVRNEVAEWNGGPRRAAFLAFSPWELPNFIVGMLARAVAARERDVTFITSRASRWTEAYLRPLGFRSFVYVEDRAPSRRSAMRTAHELLAPCATTEDVLALRYEGADVGRHAMSTALGTTRLLRADLGSGSFRQLLERKLGDSISNTVAAARILADLDPDRVVASEKGYSPEAEFFEQALLAHRDTIHWFFASRDQEIVARRYTYEDRYEHYFSLSSSTWESVKRVPWGPMDGEFVRKSIREGYLRGDWMERRHDAMKGKRLRTKAEIARSLGLTGEKKLAAIFSHILWDATFWYGTSVYPDYATWLVETIRVATQTPEVEWIVKLHPDNVWKQRDWDGHYDIHQLGESQLIQAHFPKLPPHVRLMLPEDDTSPLSLLEAADYAITVRGTVGIEAPCFGIPTFTAGTGRYAGRGFTIDSTTREEYEGRLRAIADTQPMTPASIELARRFAYATFEQKPLPITSFSWRRRRERTSPESFELRVEELATRDPLLAPDLRRFAEFVEGSEADLLAHTRSPTRDQRTPEVAA